MTRTVRTPQSVIAATNRADLAAMQAVSERFKHARPAREYITRIQAVPTIFPAFDAKAGIGGFPISRIITVQGPSNHGKSELVLGVGKSFLLRNHFFAHADAEFTTPEPWARTLFGETFDHPGFSSIPVRSYEQVRDSVLDWAENIAEAREKGLIPPDTTGLVAVDSLRKLNPQGLLKKLSSAISEKVEEAKEAEKKKPSWRKGKGKSVGMDGAGGMAGMMKAALNAAWMDELGPMLVATKTSILFVVREKEEEESIGNFTRTIYKVGGGDSVLFDPALRLRVTAKPIYEGEGDARLFVGEKKSIDIVKTKLATKRESIPRSYFHTSNGAVSPEGFDRARDILELGVDCGVIETSGAWLKYEDTKLGQGEANALKKLRADLELADAIENGCREIARAAREGA